MPWNDVVLMPVINYKRSLYFGQQCLNSENVLLNFVSPHVVFYSRMFNAWNDVILTPVIILTAFETPSRRSTGWAKRRGGRRVIRRLTRTLGPGDTMSYADSAANCNISDR